MTSHAKTTKEDRSGGAPVEEPGFWVLDLVLSTEASHPNQAP